MARIIPDYCDSDSHGEKMIFDLFRKSDHQTLDWVVIHSQNLKHSQSKHALKPQDLLLFEADFIVLIPNKGIYILEVKGGGIDCQNGILVTKNAKGEIKPIDPVFQAKRYKHHLIRYLEEIFGQETSLNTLIDFAIVFPQSPTPLRKLPDLDECQIIDSHKLSTDGLIKSLIDLSDRYKGPNKFTTEVRDKIVGFLRPSFDPVKLLGTQLNASESTIKKLTSEQYERLDDIKYNQGMIFIGAAGTGKTTLALEQFSRNCLNGVSTAFFCYNRLLGNVLERENRSKLLINKNCRISTIHSAMNEWIKATKFSKELADAEESLGKESEELYKKIYPELAIKALDELKIKFEHLILDESQDVISEPYVRFLDKLLLGGLKNGKWTFFGDFEQQVIYGAINLEEARKRIASLSENLPPVGQLKINCRNSAKIAIETAKISGFERVPTKSLNHEGTDVAIDFYKTPNEQAKYVANEIKKLVAAGVQYSDIIILSTRRLSLSGANGADASGAFRIIDVTQSKTPSLIGNQIGFCTIQAFKGLEAVAVIICDIENVEDLESKSTNYVGMSRAKSHLCIFANSTIRDTVINLRNKKIFNS